MNTRTIVASLMSGLVLVLAGLALAGVDPEPFHQLINELDSVENVLDAVDDQLKEVLSVPPEPCKPNALGGKLNAMAEKLWTPNDRVVDVIEAFPSVPPDPCHEFIDALNKVGSEALSIAEREHPPDPCTPVREALNAVRSAALAIVNTVRPMPS